MLENVNSIHQKHYKIQINTFYLHFINLVLLNIFINKKLFKISAWLNLLKKWIEYFVSLKYANFIIFYIRDGNLISTIFFVFELIILKKIDHFYSLVLEASFWSRKY